MLRELPSRCASRVNINSLSFLRLPGNCYSTPCTRVTLITFSATAASARDGALLVNNPPPLTPTPFPSPGKLVRAAVHPEPGQKGDREPPQEDRFQVRRNHSRYGRGPRRGGHQLAPTAGNVNVTVQVVGACVRWLIRSAQSLRWKRGGRGCFRRVESSLLFTF